MSNARIQKDDLREHAKRARSLLSLSVADESQFCRYFFESINVSEGDVIAFYWPKGRELDTHLLMDQCSNLGAHIVLPVIEKNSKILKFVSWGADTEMEVGSYGILQPKICDNTSFIDPDIIIVPFLAFDRRGYRLGYGGGYYDATISDLRKRKDLLCVGVGFSKQACLFNLPHEDHDVRMDWIITELSTQQFT